MNRLRKINQDVSDYLSRNNEINIDDKLKTDYFIKLVEEFKNHINNVNIKSDNDYDDLYKIINNWNTLMEHIGDNENIVDKDKYNHFSKLKWKRLKCNNVIKFQLSDEPEVIYIIKTAFDDKYIIVQEDAYEINIGDTEILSEADIKAKYDIDINEKIKK